MYVTHCNALPMAADLFYISVCTSSLSQAGSEASARPSAWTLDGKLSFFLHTCSNVLRVRLETRDGDASLEKHLDDAVCSGPHHIFLMLCIVYETSVHFQTYAHSFIYQLKYQCKTSDIKSEKTSVSIVDGLSLVDRLLGFLANNFNIGQEHWLSLRNVAGQCTSQKVLERKWRTCFSYDNLSYVQNFSIYLLPFLSSDPFQDLIEIFCRTWLFSEAWCGSWNYSSALL